MKKLISSFIGIIFLLSSFSSNAVSLCTGHFVNPVTDICWTCFFPLSIGSIKTGTSSGNTDTPNPSSPIQVCPMGNFVRVGLAIGYWEPSYLVDVTREPMCMVNLGGFKMGSAYMDTSALSSSKSTNQAAFYNAHWYVFPIMGWLNMIFSTGCMQLGDFGVAYLSELDPMWEDDELAAILTPESSVFANVIAQGACAADAIASSFGMPLDPLFWCAGSQGGMFPLTGHIIEQTTPFKSSLLAAERMAFKMHREGLIMNTIGADKAVCYAYPSPIMPKSRWRYQLVNPFPLQRCESIGRSTFIWENGINIPTDQKNHGYLFWRKRNCVYL